MIDLHTHILPELDDGPPTVEAALAMARAAVATGTTAMATTSHVGYHFTVDPEDIARARAALAERLAAEGIALELLAGGEIAPDRLPDLDDEALRALALGGGPYVLFECPFTPVAGMEAMPADLQRRGFRVLLAHPERSPSFQRDLGLLRSLVEGGALAQITTGSLAGGFGELPRRAALAMLEQGLVHVLASDAHSPHHRGPDLRETGDVLGPAEHEWMTTAVPAAIVAGTPLPPRPGGSHLGQRDDRAREHEHDDGDLRPEPEARHTA
jgi:protein-tyrosine phosphatase